MSLFAISGSQGTGKSTLLQALGYPSIERKTSRSILTDWGVTLSEVNNDRQLTTKFQDEILRRKVLDEQEAAASPAVYFTERTYADLFVYALVAIGKDNEYSDWLNHYYDQCVQAQVAYSRVFYLTAGHFVPVNDGVRAVNPHYSCMVDLTMRSYTMRMSNRVQIIDTPELDLRVQYINEMIK